MKRLTERELIILLDPTGKYSTLDVQFNVINKTMEKEEFKPAA